MKTVLVLLTFFISLTAFAKVETICGTLDFAKPLEIGGGSKFKDYKVHEIRNNKDKIYYEIVDGEDLSEKSRYDEVCITGEVIRLDKVKHLMQKMPGRPDKIRVQSFTDAD